jgi:hypothetical protein
MGDRGQLLLLQLGKSCRVVQHTDSVVFANSPRGRLLVLLVLHLRTNGLSVKRERAYGF